MNIPKNIFCQNFKHVETGLIPSSPAYVRFTYYDIFSYSLVVVLNRMANNPNYGRGTFLGDHKYHRFSSKSISKQLNRRRVVSFCKSDK